MAFYALKVALSAFLIVLISETGKRNATFAALIASLPIISLASFLWMHAEALPDARIADVAQNIFWLALPSLVLFLVMPALLRGGWGFWPSLTMASALTAACYGLATILMAKLELIR